MGLLMLLLMQPIKPPFVVLFFLNHSISLTLVYIPSCFSIIYLAMLSLPDVSRTLALAVEQHWYSMLSLV